RHRASWIGSAFGDVVPAPAASAAPNHRDPISSFDASAEVLWRSGAVGGEGIRGGAPFHSTRRPARAPGLCSPGPPRSPRRHFLGDSRLVAVETMVHEAFANARPGSLGPPPSTLNWK